MKALFLYFVISLVISSNYAQTHKIDRYLDKIPKENASFQSPLKYQLAIDWINKDIDGKVIMHNIAVGKLIQAQPNDTVQLQDVFLTEISDNGKNTRKVYDLEGLKFKIMGDNFTHPEFYKDFPPSHIELIRWFIQDKVAFEVYGQMYLDSLKLNIPFYPDLFQNHQSKFDQYVNFNTQKLNLTWIGISKINGKICALVHYQSIYNPIDADNDIMTLNGRSCFWGNIWISLASRRIEYATMNEDLIYKMKLKTNNFEQKINMQREIKLEKIK